MIALARRDGQPIRVGHRGAAALAPENTLEGFRAAAAHGVDLIEFDVLELERGPLVLAHSGDLSDVSHGAALGTVPTSLEALREVAPHVPTLDEALTFFVDEAPHLGLHVDLKLKSRLDELCDAIGRFGLSGRTVVSSFHNPSLRAVARHDAHIRIGLTYPEDRMGISRRPRLWPAVALGLAAMRASVPARLPSMLSRAGATACMLQHRLVTRAAVDRAHAIGVDVLAWTVDEPADLVRVVDAGVDGVITNDPRIFADG